MEKNPFFSFHFVEEENSNQWNKNFLYNYKNGNKKEVLKLLKEADNLYMDEYFIYSCIYTLNSNASSDNESIFNSLKKCNLVKDVVVKNNTMSIKLANNPTVYVSKLSDILSDVNLESHSNDDVLKKSTYSAEYISQLLSFQNRIVTGYVYGIADKAKSLTTWVEFKNNNNQEFVVDYNSNTVLNKDAFYFIRHAEPIKKVSGDDLKGKSSVAKLVSYNAEQEVPDIEVEFDFDR